MSSVGNVILFTGRWQDTETGLMYYRARYYSADLGVFVGRDPIAADINLYRYCGNNPLVSVDPTGMIGIFFDGAGQAIGTSTVMQRLAARYTGGKAYIYQTNIWPNNITGNIGAAYDRVCASVCPKNNSTPPSQMGIVDIFGWSRGGVAALTLAKVLKDPGCVCKCGTIKPVIVHYLGLIDPVATGGLQMWGKNSAVVTNNVQNVAIAWAGKLSTVGYIIFNASQLTLEDVTTTTRNDATYPTTHEAIGFSFAVENWLATQTSLRVFK